MLNIYCSLKTVNVLKIKRLVLENDAPIGIPWRKCGPEVTPCFKITQIKTTYPCELYWNVFEGYGDWCNINNPFGLNITCSINT